MGGRGGAHLGPGRPGASGGGSGRPGHPPLLGARRLLHLLPALEVLDGSLVLEVDEGHGDGGVPAALVRAPKVNLLAVLGDDGEVDVLARALHAVHLEDGAEAQLLALGPLVPVGEEAEAVLGQHHQLLLPQLEKAVAPLLQLALADHLGLHLHPPFFGGSAAAPAPARAAMTQPRRDGNNLLQ